MPYISYACREILVGLSRTAVHLGQYLLKISNFLLEFLCHRLYHMYLSFSQISTQCQTHFPRRKVVPNPVSCLEQVGCAQQCGDPEKQIHNIHLPLINCNYSAQTDDPRAAMLTTLAVFNG